MPPVRRELHAEGRAFHRHDIADDLKREFLTDPREAQGRASLVEQREHRLGGVPVEIDEPARAEIPACDFRRDGRTECAVAERVERDGRRLPSAARMEAHRDEIAGGGDADRIRPLQRLHHLADFRRGGIGEIDHRDPVAVAQIGEPVRALALRPRRPGLDHQGPASIGRHIHGGGRAGDRVRRLDLHRAPLPRIAAEAEDGERIAPLARPEIAVHIGRGHHVRIGHGDDVAALKRHAPVPVPVRR